MLARMKSCNSPNNIDYRYKSPNQSPFKHNGVCMNETGVLLANGSFKSQQNHFINQNTDKLLSTHNSLSQFESQNIKNTRANIVSGNCNNTMPFKNLITNKNILLNEHEKIIEEVNSNRPSPNDRTLDINVVRYKDDDELN